MTPAVHSNPSSGRWEADLVFSNQTTTTLLIYPTTPLGRRGKVTKLRQAEEVTVNAQIGGVHVVESTDGTVHQIHSPSVPTRTVVVATASDGSDDRSAEDSVSRD